jgi:hypothetical protein
MKQTLEKAFYLVLLLVTLYIQFGMAQDTLGMKYLNTRPMEQLKLQDGRILVIMDDLWKNTQIIKFKKRITSERNLSGFLFCLSCRIRLTHG